MVPSRLSELIVIEKESSAKNRVGTQQESYVFLKETYADLFVQGGTTQYGAEGQLPFSQSVFTIRYDENVDYKCRLIYKNNYYKIEHIQEIGRNHWQRLRCVVWERATQF